MPHLPRDPETGQFLSQKTIEAMGFEDVEVVSFLAEAGVLAADLTGSTNFVTGDAFEYEGIELIDYDEVVDRNEEVVLISAYHNLSVMANSTETADGTVTGSAEVSASPQNSPAGRAASSTTDVPPGDSPVVGFGTNDDTIDLIGRPLLATGHAPFSDGASGVGGGGSAGEDRVSVWGLPEEIARFHPRDELFMNGRIQAWNIDDAGVHVKLNGQHVYGVISD